LYMNLDLRIHVEHSHLTEHIYIYRPQKPEGQGRPYIYIYA